VDMAIPNIFPASRVEIHPSLIFLFFFPFGLIALPE
jgi:hypothetical protein